MRVLHAPRSRPRPKQRRPGEEEQRRLRARRLAQAPGTARPDRPGHRRRGFQHAEDPAALQAAHGGGRGDLPGVEKRHQRFAFPRLCIEGTRGQRRRRRHERVHADAADASLRW